MPIYKQVKKITSKGYEVKTYSNGVIHHLLNGQAHKTDGPAIIYSRSDHPDREDGWYLHGKPVDKVKVLHLKECPVEELPLYMNTIYEFIVKERLNGNI
jgi:hypothetical protein